MPIYSDNDQVIGVLSASVSGNWTSDAVKDLIIAKTGYCYVINREGGIIGYKDEDRVKTKANAITIAKTDKTFASLGSFLESVIEDTDSGIGYYKFKGVANIAAFKKIEHAGGRAIIATAPLNEFLDSVNTLRAYMIFIGALILFIAVTVIWIVALGLVKPVQNTVKALKGIAQGDGDLTVRLPLQGNDEVTQLSHYFNETIGKIRNTIKGTASRGFCLWELFLLLSEQILKVYKIHADTVKYTCEQYDRTEQVALLSCLHPQALECRMNTFVRLDEL